MTTLTITVDPSSPLPSYAMTLATLPVSFAGHGDIATADVVHCSGAGDWTRRASELIEQGARALIISDPEPADPQDVRRLLDTAQQHSTAVELAEPYAGDPALSVHAAALTAHLAGLTALVITENTPDLTPDAAALSIARLVRALGRTLTLTSIRSHADTVFVNGTAGELLVQGLVTRSRAGVQQRVQGLGFGRTLDIRLLGSANARPSEITVSTMGGETRLSTTYETAERTAWTRLHCTLTAGQRDSTSLAGFADDLDTIHAQL